MQDIGPLSEKIVAWNRWNVWDNLLRALLFILNPIYESMKIIVMPIFDLCKYVGLGHRLTQDEYTCVGRTMLIQSELLVACSFIVPEIKIIC